MKPKNLRILFSMALALGLSAQSYGSETVSEAGAGQFLLYNVGAKQYLCPGNAWGTHASVGNVGMMVDWYHKMMVPIACQLNLIIIPICAWAIMLMSIILAKEHIVLKR